MTPPQRPEKAQEKGQNGMLRNELSKSPRFSKGHLASVLLAVTLIVYAYFQSPEAVSSSYAICSKDGKRIYTVDAQNSQTQCIVIRGSFIVDTGLLRRSPPINYRTMFIYMSRHSSQRMSRDVGINSP